MSTQSKLVKALSISLSLSANAQKWINWAVTADATGNLIPFDQGQALLNPSAPPAPAANTNFLFTLPNNVWPNWKHNSQEHANSLSPGADRDAAFANLDHANQIWNMEGHELSFPMACYPFINGSLDTNHPIPNTMSWPSRQLTSQPSGTIFDTSTDAGVLAFCTNTHVPTSGSADPHGHIPGA